MSMLNDEQREIQQLVRRFAQNELAPHAEEWAERAYFPREIFPKMADLGLAGMLVPEEVGGTNLGRFLGAIVFEELARADLTTAVWLSVHNMVTSLIYRFGNDEQRQRWVTRLAAGELLGAFSLSEANSGSDAAAMTTTARREGDHYIINGSKLWVTSGGVAEVYVVMVRTTAGTAHGISALVIEKDTPGFSFGKLEHKMGLHASPTRELLFEDCRVPVDNRLGQEGEGFKIALSSLDGGRINIGASATGLASAALEVATRYAQERKQFGRPIAAFQGIQFMLADMAMKIEAARLLVRQAAAKADEGDPALSLYAAMAKCFATDTAMQVTTDAVQVLGGAGYVHDWPVERYMREAKVTQIFEGTNQIQRVVIARQLMGRLATETMR
ncbi:MAG TPA: acyl-CoA dehydrogenase family protein [Ktedonobacterales bacterium]